MTKLLIIANDESTLLNFRLEILKHFADSGYQVIACYPLGENTEKLLATGCQVEHLSVSRRGKNVLQDLKMMLNCCKLIKKHQPQAVLTYTVKPNIYASFACMLTKTPYINNVTGLGSALTGGGVLARLILLLQQLAYKKSSCVFFQNEANQQALMEKGVISAKTPTRLLPGSGVNLSMQKLEDFPEDDAIVRFVMVSRIREDKGFGEYFEAAQKLKNANTEFHVVGGCEEESWMDRLQQLQECGVIIYHGKKTQQEVHQIVAQCQCLVHPSYHEGMANVLLEAAATGRPVVATDIPGCRETFDEGITGFGCQVKNGDSLVAAIQKMLDTPYETRKKMGLMGRQKMEQQFDRKIVAKIYTEEIEKIMQQKETLANV